MTWFVFPIAALLLGSFGIGGELLDDLAPKPELPDVPELPGGADDMLDERLGGAQPAPGDPDGVVRIADDDAPLVTAGALLAGLLATTLVAAGTKHVNRDNVLEHDTRRSMYEFLWEAGSAHLRRIATALELSTTNATWHLDKLVKAGLVGEVKVNGYRMYYPKGGGRILRDQCLLAAQVQSENARAVVEFVSENPGSHQREIARALGVNHGTARWHLSRLADSGILAAQKNGRTTEYELTDNAKQVLDHGLLESLPEASTSA